MTTGATVFGHFPLVLVEGAGAEARNSIGFILVIGMLIGTLFTLVLLPAIYALLASDHQSAEPVQTTPRRKIQYRHSARRTSTVLLDAWGVRGFNTRPSGYTPLFRPGSSVGRAVD